METVDYNNNFSEAEQEQHDESSRHVSHGLRHLPRSSVSTAAVQRASKYNLRSRSAVGPGEPKEDDITHALALKRKGKARPLPESAPTPAGYGGNWNINDGLDFIGTRNLNEVSLMASLVLGLPFILYGVISGFGLFLDLFYWCTWMWTALFCLAFYFNDVATIAAQRTKTFVHAVLLFLLFLIQYADSEVPHVSSPPSKATRVPSQHDVEIVEVTSDLSHHQPMSLPSDNESSQ